MGVEFRPVVGFPGYFVGSDGTVGRERVNTTGRRRPRRAGVILFKGHARRNGRVFSLTPVADVKDLYARRNPCCYREGGDLVLTAFVEPRPPGCVVCRADGDSLNNDLGNLFWGRPNLCRAGLPSEAAVGAHLVRTLTANRTADCSCGMTPVKALYAGLRDAFRCSAGVQVPARRQIASMADAGAIRAVRDYNARLVCVGLIPTPEDCSVHQHLQEETTWRHESAATLRKMRSQVRAIKRWLRSRDPAAFQSLPEGFGPLATSRS